MTRRVVIIRDTSAALALLRCEAPCRATGWCMDMGGGRMGCYLGASLTECGAALIAMRAGYVVVAAP